MTTTEAKRKQRKKTSSYLPARNSLETETHAREKFKKNLFSHFTSRHTTVDCENSILSHCSSVYLSNKIKACHTAHES